MNKINELLHGEYIMLQLLQQTMAGFLAMSKHIEYMDGLLVKIRDDKEVRLMPYYNMLSFFIHEFKKVADNDPTVAEMIQEGEKLAFLKSMGVPTED
jgi:hypothetical protein